MIRQRIVYVGPGLAGRCTSRAVAFRGSGKDAFSFNDPHVAHEIVLGERLLSATISQTRSNRYYACAEIGERDPKVRWEIDQLAAADGLIFVADSQRERVEANIEQMERLRDDLAWRGVDLGEVPLVIQANKRDLPNIVSVESLWADLRPRRAAIVETVAKTGFGVMEALWALAQSIDRCEGYREPQRP